MGWTDHVEKACWDKWINVEVDGRDAPGLFVLAVLLAKEEGAKECIKYPVRFVRSHIGSGGGAIDPDALL